MQLQVLDSLTIHAQPMIDVSILFTGVTFLNLSEPVLIDAGENWPKWQAKNGTLRSAPAAPVSFAAHQFRDFSVELHFSAAAISRSKPGPR